MHLVNVFELRIVAGDPFLARHFRRQGVRGVQIKEVDKHENRLAAVGVKPLARGTHHQSAVPPQAHGQGDSTRRRFLAERAVVISKPWSKP